jgi:hypothetical protein
MNIIFFTDSITSINGMSKFSNYFIKSLVKNSENKIFIIETNNDKITILNPEINSYNIIDLVYVNGHFSKADMLVRNKSLLNLLSVLGLKTHESSKIIIISHGWFKLKYRLNLYSILYNLKYFYRTITFDSYEKFYHSILFISDKNDNHRHFDFNWCVKKHKCYQFVDFTNGIILENNLIKSETGNEGFILVISNFDTVKNLLLLARINLKQKMIGKAYKNFTLLSTPPNSFTGKLSYKFLLKLGVNIVFDQSKKNQLLSYCNYLFIPSYTEYLPLVALEAFSFKKQVVSYYFILGLSDQNGYKYIRK